VTAAAAGHNAYGFPPCLWQGLEVYRCNITVKTVCCVFRALLEQGLEIHLVHGCNITEKTHFAVFPALFVARPGSVQMQHYGQNRLLFFPSLVGGKAWKFI